MSTAGNLAKIKAYCSEIETLMILEQLSDHIQFPTDLIRQHVDPFLDRQMNYLDEMAIYLNQKRLELDGPSMVKFYELHKMNDEEIHRYKSILDGLVDWQFPCLDLFPGRGDTLPGVLGAEPLFTADWHDEVLNNVAQQFNYTFAEKRLMQYKISKYDMTPLPQKTFGLVYSLHWTMFENADNIEEIAKSVHSLLMPGGLFLFNYNPLDKWWGIEQYGDIKGYYGAYTNELKTRIRNVGFKILRLNREPGQLSFMLCRKQGELNHVKLSSTLAKIIEKDVELL